MTISDKNHVSLILFQHQSHIAVKIYFSQYLQMLLTDDILQAIDNQTCVALLLLDLSAAFDTVDHQLLVERLSNRFGLKGQFLTWLKSYLENQTQVIMIDGVKSAKKTKNNICRVPQGSILGM